MSKTRRMKKAASIIEVMTAVAVFAIIILGSSTLYVSGRSHITLQGQYRVAIGLVSQQIEDLKAADPATLNKSSTEEQITIERITYNRQTKIEDYGPLKKLMVSVAFQFAGKERIANAATLIAP